MQLRGLDCDDEDRDRAAALQTDQRYGAVKSHLSIGISWTVREHPG